MNLQPGAIYEHRRDGDRVCVIEHRPPDHPKGNGLDSAIALPVRDVNLETLEPEPWAHPLDVTILCPEQKAHGPERWLEVTDYPVTEAMVAAKTVRRDRYEENRERDKGPTV